MAMSGTLITSGWSKSYPTAKLKFEWDAEKTGLGTSKVTWTLKGTGRGASPTYLAT
jgi:hypothetical protein